MWLLFGVLAVITALLNVGFAAAGKDGRYFQFASLSFTALTLCAAYSLNASWVLHEDWSALMDVVPTMSKSFWGLTLASIGFNSLSLLKKHSRK